MTNRKRIALIDNASPFDTLETLERHLREMQALPADTLLRDEIIQETKDLIAKQRSTR